MKHILCTFLFLSLVHSMTAQRNQSDSLKSIQIELAEINRQFRDSLRANTRYMELQEQLTKLRSASDNYRGFILYSSVTSADFSKFNAQNAADNFSAISDPMISIGYGFTFKKNRRIFDLNVGTMGLSKKSTAGNESIKTSFGTFLQLEWGYDLIRSNRINIYPYAGIGLRSSSLDYKSPVETNAAIINVTDIIQNNKSFAAYHTELGYQAGMGLEFVLTSPARSGGTLIFIKAGTNRAFKNKAFEIEGIKYQPDFRYGDLVGSVGFKFFGR